MGAHKTCRLPGDKCKQCKKNRSSLLTRLSNVVEAIGQAWEMFDGDHLGLNSFFSVTSITPQQRDVSRYAFFLHLIELIL